MLTSNSRPSTDTDIDTAASEEDRIVAAAAAAARPWAATSRADRGTALRAVADALDARAEQLIELAGRETHLPNGRLSGELKRTTFQLRFFAEALDDGAYLGVRVDHADPDWPMGAPRPDLRRRLQPLGPVVVFAASNFPFAFSVCGGDTAAALAAGCPVILKAHPGHPELSVATAAIAAEALAAAGAPDGVFALVSGQQAGVTVLQDPRVKAGAFTGSIKGGRALFDLAVARPEPIPFFGELGSLNPAFVTRAAATARGAAIATEAVGSFTMGAGQFCTKPGLLVVPADSTIPAALADADLPAATPLLNNQITSGYRATLEGLADHDGVEVLRRAEDWVADPPTPTVLRTTTARVLANPEALLGECFGPTLLVATYEDETELLALAEALDGQLTATIVGENSDLDEVGDLLVVLAEKAGRVLWNQWPTGVSVTYAQQHGGPYPATTAPGTTSVGTAAIERFLRPVAFQGFPAALLPPELRDDADLPRRVDGHLAR